MPAFVKDIPDKSVDLDETFTFQAEIYGYPAPEVTWYVSHKCMNSKFTTSCFEVLN